MSEPALTTVRPWKPAKHSYQEALQYMQDRQQGKVTSLKTPWNKINEAIADGIEWNHTLIIAARPATGKTLIKDQIVRDAFRLNPLEKFRILEFQFEMVGRVSALRAFSAILKKTYKFLINADKKEPITSKVINECYEHAKKVADDPVDVVDNPCTVDEFCRIIAEYMEAHAVIVKDKDGKDVKVYTKTIITVDHSLLFKKAQYEKDKQEMLFNLGDALTRLKRKYPIIFIILSQLNRDIDRPERNEDGKYGNYVLESDIYGADALLQHADTVIGVNRPAKQKINYYGVERYIIEGMHVLVFHFLKCRNGEVQLSFMRAEFENMKVSEMDPPGKQERKLSIP